MKKTLALALFAYVIGIVAPLWGGDISNFLTPYGFREPPLKQHQLILNSGYDYHRVKYTSDDIEFTPLILKTTEKTYYYYLEASYAVTNWLVIGSNLDIYPHQTRSTYPLTYALIYYPDDRRIWIDEVIERSDFFMSPCFTLSFRPRSNMEIYGSYSYYRESLDILEQNEQLTEYYLDRNSNSFDFGFTFLGRSYLQKNDSISSFQFLNFCTPYAFGAPLLKKGQYVFSLNTHFDRTEYKTGVKTPGVIVTYLPRKYSTRSYYFSLNTFFAVTDAFVFETSLTIYPGQLRSTHNGGFILPPYGGVHRIEYEGHSEFTIAPRLGISYRLGENTEIYGSSYFQKERMSNQRYLTGTSAHEIFKYYYFNLGFTLLGNPDFKHTETFSDAGSLGFLTPAGFRNPLLRQGQYVLNFNSHYRESKTGLESWNVTTYTSQERTYLFSLNGVYAVMGNLILGLNLTFYPAQTRATYQETMMYSMKWSGRKENFDFSVSPSCNISLRPKRNIEFYGSFFLNKEEFYIERQYEPDSPTLSHEDYWIDFGLTILGKPW